MTIIYFFLALFLLCFGRFVQDFIDEAVFHGLLRVEIEIAVGIVGYLVHRLAGMLDQDFLDDILLPHYLFGGDDDIRRLSLGAAHRLVHVDGGVGQRVALALGAGAEQHGSHAGRHADADGGYLRADKLHGVVNGQAGADDAARAAKVERVTDIGAGSAIALTCLNVMTTLIGSALIPLARVSGRLSLEKAWDAAHVDEDFQIRLWGTDTEALARRAQRFIEMAGADRLWQLIATLIYEGDFSLRSQP